MRAQRLQSFVMLILISLGALVSCGTKGLFTLIDKESKALSSEARRLSHAEPVEKKMGWGGARKRMLKENLNLIRERSRLSDIRRQRRNQWREWLPRPSLFLSFQAQIRELGDITKDDLASSFYAPLAIPNPVTQRSKAYQYALQEVQAEDVYELNRRRQIANLYSMFHEWQNLKDQWRSNAGMSIDDEIQAALRNDEKRMDEENAKDRFFARMERMLNLPGVNVVPKADTLPDIDYQNKLEELVPGVNYGRLGAQLSTYQIAAAVLRSKGVKIRQWPAPQANLGVPAIYNSRRDEEFLSSDEQIQLFSSWNKAFDLTGRVASSIENAEDYVIHVRKSLQLELQADAREWGRLKKRYYSILRKRSLLRSRLSRMMDQDDGSTEQLVDETRRVLEDLRNLERAKQQLDIQIWIWDDEAWK